MVWFLAWKFKLVPSKLQFFVCRDNSAEILRKFINFALFGFGAFIGLENDGCPRFHHWHHEKKRVFFSGTVTPLPIVVSTRASVSTTPVSSSIVVSSQPGILLPAVQATESTDISHSHGSSGFKVTKMITIWISMSALLAIIVSKNCHSLIYSTWTWGQNQNMFCL